MHSTHFTSKYLNFNSTEKVGSRKYKNDSSVYSVDTISLNGAKHNAD